MSARLLVVVALSALAAAGCGHGRVPSQAIRIGVLTDCAGPFAAYGDLALAGAELALIQHGGQRAGSATADGVVGVTIAGRPLKLVFGCNDENTGVGVLTEARRLVEGEGVDVLIGPLAGNEEVVVQSYARRQPRVAFVDGSGSVQLTQPAPNFFSFHTDGAQWTAGLGAYAYKTLGWRSAVTIANEPDAFNWAQVAGFTAEFCALGGDVVRRVWIRPGISDLSGVIAEIPRAGVDGFFVESSDALIALARSYRGLQGNIGRKVIGGALAFTAKNYVLGLDRIRGLTFGTAVPGSGVRGLEEPTRRYSAAIRHAFPELGATVATPFDLFYYGATVATLHALDAVHGDLSRGERKFMTALARTRIDLPNGPVRLDRLHRAIAPNYLVRVNGQSSSPLQTIPAVEPSFGGHFGPSDPPPGETTPRCLQGSPPRWAR